jgi:hypothetical protein
MFRKVVKSRERKTTNASCRSILKTRKRSNARSDLLPPTRSNNLIIRVACVESVLFCRTVEHRLFKI